MNIWIGTGITPIFKTPILYLIELKEFFHIFIILFIPGFDWLSLIGKLFSSEYAEILGNLLAAERI